MIQVLSLYLLLLAIFVLLYNLSRAEESRVRSVTGSLNSTFSSRGTPTQEPDVLTSLLGTVLEHSRVREKFGQLVKTDIPLAKVEVVTPGQTLQARFPVTELFETDSVRIRAARRRLIKKIASLLGEAPPGVRFDLEVIVGGGWTPRRASDGKVSLPIGRASRMADEIISAGAPPASTAGGIDQNDLGWVKLLFHVRAADEPRGPYAEPDEGEPQ